MGPTGRGCCEYTGVDPADVDVLMGTFTKSFGGMGGYVAADKRVIDELRRECAGSAYHNSLSPVVCQQIISSFQVCCARRCVCISSNPCLLALSSFLSYTTTTHHRL